MSDLTGKLCIVCHVYHKYYSIKTFHGLSKGLIGCDIGLELAQNQVLPFFPWKGDRVGFLGRVSNPHEWLDREIVHCLSCISQVLRRQNISWPLQGSFSLKYRAKVGPKPSFAIFAMERRQFRVFRYSKWSPLVTWHGSSALIVMSIISIKSSKCFVASPSVFLAVI